MPGTTVYRTLSFISVDAHVVTVMVMVIVLGVDGPLCCLSDFCLFVKSG